ncbi:SDR family oxidoreductase [Streptomyces sp. NPDC054834]
MCGAWSATRPIPTGSRRSPDSSARSTSWSTRPAACRIGSIGAERRGGSYGAAKAALAAWNASLSGELGPLGVTCNVISAGYIVGTDFFRGGTTDERHSALVAETHDKSPGTVDDIAATAHFLASPGPRHITGQTIHVNGGAFTTR